MLILRSICITITGPYENGGVVKIFDGTTQVLPDISLLPLPGLQHLRKEDKRVSVLPYKFFFNQEDLPYTIFENSPTWQVIGEPKENVSVEVVTEFQHSREKINGMNSVNGGKPNG